MRTVIVALALTGLVVAAPARAGHSCPAYIALPHVVYGPGYLQNGYFEPVAMLRARGLALLLEERVADMIARGALADKRLHVDRDHGWGDPHPQLRVSRNDRAFFIEGAQALDLRDLLRTIDYFGSETWASFHYDGVPARLEPPADPSRSAGWPNTQLVRRFGQILDAAVPEPDVEAFRARRVTVYRVGDLEIAYRNDALSCEIAGEPLAVELAGFLPVRVGNRYVLQTTDAIVAVEGSRIVARVPWTGPDPAGHACHDNPLDVQSHAAWVNIGCTGTQRIVLTYSLERNRFIPVDVEGSWNRRRVTREIGLFTGECG